jgi:NADH-quinone oxidoreductase subunit G
MAAAPQAQTVNVTINGVELAVPSGELVVESVKRLWLEVPVFCYHPRMKPVGMCRMCLVEVGFKQPDGSVRMMPKPQAGCTLPASEGMVVLTDSESVHRDRKGVLEFLLINHPLDCPICDRGGECPLQNNTMAYGPSTTRFIEIKRHLPKAFPLSKYVTLDLERCIQCGRCVRFTEEISGDADLAFRFRGAEMQPSTFQLTDFESKFSGNVIEICPVGALTSAKYRFRARPWDLEAAPAVCTLTPCGTNVWLDHRAGRLVRINGRTNEEVNEEWTSDRTKFGHDFYNDPGRLTVPNVRDGDGFKPAAWGDVYDPILAAFAGGGDEVGMIVAPSLSNEALFLAQRLVRTVFGSENIDHRVSGPWVPRAESLRASGTDPVQSTIAELEHKSAVLVFGTGLADEQPMTFLRVRKGWFQRNMAVVAATPQKTEVDAFAAASLRYRPGTEATLAQGLADLAAGKGSASDVAAATGADQAQVEAAAKTLAGSGFAIVTTESLLTGEEGRRAAKILGEWAARAGGQFNCWPLHANSNGATELGALPDALPGFAPNERSGLDVRAMLQAAADGRLKALWLVGTDPLAEFPDRALAEKALETVPFLVVSHGLPVEACSYASVVLPMAFAAEQDGTYTSAERRVQRMRPALRAPGEAKPAWRIFSECLLRAKPMTPLFNPREVMDEIAQAVPAFAVARYDALPETGVVLRTGSGAGEPEPALAGETV